MSAVHPPVVFTTSALLIRILRNPQVSVTINDTAVRTTTSLTPVMAGYGVASSPVTYMPLKTGIVEILCTYQAWNTVNNDGVSLQLAWGSNTPPSSGAAAAGTKLGSLFKIISSTVNAYETGSVTDIILNAPVFEKIWIDLQYSAITAGTASLGPATFIIKELDQ